MTSTTRAGLDQELAVFALSSLGLVVEGALVWYSYQFTVCLLGGAGPNPPTATCAPNIRFFLPGVIAIVAGGVGLVYAFFSRVA